MFQFASEFCTEQQIWSTTLQMKHNAVACPTNFNSNCAAAMQLHGDSCTALTKSPLFEQWNSTLVLYAEMISAFKLIKILRLQQQVQCPLMPLNDLFACQWWWRWPTCCWLLPVVHQVQSTKSLLWSTILDQSAKVSSCQPEPGTYHSRYWQGGAQPSLLFVTVLHAVDKPLLCISTLWHSENGYPTLYWHGARSE